MSEAGFELRIEPGSEKFDANDDRWLQQVNTLSSDLQAEIGSVRTEREAVAGHKGGVEALILALGSAGAFTAAIEIFKAWLSRSPDRVLTLTVVRDGKEHQVSVSGKGMSEDTVKELMQAGLGDGG